MTSGNVTVNAGVTVTIEADIISDNNATKKGDVTAVVTGNISDFIVDAGMFVLTTTSSAQQLTVNEGGTAIIEGSVEGNLINHGTVTIFGDRNANGTANSADIDMPYFELPVTVPVVFNSVPLVSDMEIAAQDIRKIVPEHQVSDALANADTSGDDMMTVLANELLRHISNRRRTERDAVGSGRSANLKTAAAFTAVRNSENPDLR